jgi:hypothetical protein
MISLLISIIVLCLIVSLVVWAIRLLPIPAPFGNIVVVLVVVVAALYLLSELGGVGGLGLHRLN